MKRIILYTIFSVFSLSLFAANDIVRVSATYEYFSNNPNESPAQAEQTAIERAKQKALEDKFGIDVTAITSTFTTSQARGGEATSQTNIFSLGSTSVRGEWIETTKQQILKKSFTDGW